MKVPFYILGLLQRYGPQHGYKLKQIIEDEISDFAKIKLPTIYYHLDKLKKDEYVIESLDKDGNRPEKLVYSITSKGKEYFMKLFIEQLSQDYCPEFSLDGILYFIETSDYNTILNAFKDKKQKILLRLQNLKDHKSRALRVVPEKGKLSAGAIFDHHIYHLKAELKWLEKTIEGLSK